MIMTIRAPYQYQGRMNRVLTTQVMTSEGDATTENAVYDPELTKALNNINSLFGDLCVRVCGEVWGKPLISQRTKALITIALDVANSSFHGPGVPFETHVKMALKLGATYEEIEELLLFTCAYCGFNKSAGAFGQLKRMMTEI